MAQKDYFEIKGVRLGRPTVRTVKQRDALGEQLAWAVSEGREIELRNQKRSILVLVTPADDLGHVYKIDTKGVVSDIGFTEKPLGEE